MGPAQSIQEALGAWPRPPRLRRGATAADTISTRCSRGRAPPAASACSTSAAGWEKPRSALRLRVASGGRYDLTPEISAGEQIAAERGSAEPALRAGRRGALAFADASFDVVRRGSAHNVAAPAGDGRRCRRVLHAAGVSVSRRDRAR